jgi:hypothetical protein
MTMRISTKDFKDLIGSSADNLQEDLGLKTNTLDYSMGALKC